MNQEDTESAFNSTTGCEQWDPECLHLCVLSDLSLTNTHKCAWKHPLFHASASFCRPLRDIWFRSSTNKLARIKGETPWQPSFLLFTSNCLLLNPSITPKASFTSLQSPLSENDQDPPCSQRLNVVKWPQGQDCQGCLCRQAKGSWWILPLRLWRSGKLAFQFKSLTRQIDSSHTPW